MAKTRIIFLVAFILGLLWQGASGQTWDDLLKHADSLYYAGSHDSAIVINNQALIQAIEENGIEDTSSAWIFHSLGRCYGGKSEFETADSLTRIALRLKRQLLPPDHPSILKSMSNIALFNELNGKKDIAENMCLDAISEFEKVSTPVFGILVQTYWKLNWLYYKQDKYEEAANMMHQALTFIARSGKAESKEYVTTIGALARDYLASAKYDKAAFYADSALEIGERFAGVNDTVYADALRRAGWIYYYVERTDEAESLILKSLSINESLFGSESPEVKRVLHYMGLIYRRQAKFSEAENTYLRTLQLYEIQEGDNSTGLANHCFNMALFYLSFDRLDDAEKFIRRALGIWGNIFGSKCGDFAAGLRVLGAIYVDRGDYAQAEPIYLESLSTMKAAVGPQHDDVGHVLRQLGYMYTELGMYEKAQKYFTDALSIDEQFPLQRNIALSLKLMGMILTRQGYSKEGESYYQRALDIRKEINGVEHPQYAFALKSLGWNYMHQERYDEARDMLNDAAKIYSKYYDSTNTAIGSVQWNLAYINRRLGNVDIADSLYLAAYSVYERVYGPKHVRCAGIMEDHSKCLRMKGDYQNALTRSHIAYCNKINELKDNIIILSERDALDYSKIIRESVDNYMSSWIDAGKMPTVEAADVILVSKGLVFDEVINRNRSLIDEGNEEVQAMVKTLKNTKLLLSHYVITGPENIDLDRYHYLLDSLQTGADNQESELARLSSSFKRQLELNNINSEQVSEYLPDDCILVEYLKYNYDQPGSDNSESRYVASVLSQNGNIDVIDLGNASDIEPLVGQYRRHMLEVSVAGRLPTVIDAENYRRISQRLYDKIWKPVEKRAVDGGLVLVAADGGLNMVSFAGLIDSDGKYLVENNSIHYLSSGRDVIRFQDEVQLTSGLFALGDPDYNATALARLSIPDETPSDSLPEPDYYAVRNVRSGCGNLNDITVTALPFTRREVESVAAAWDASLDEEMTVCYGSDASEERFKAEAPGNRVIHLATHGYFLQGACQVDLIHTGSADDLGYVGENPLLLSGLFFAGANLHGEGADKLGTEDGILTAYEVSAMDLTGTDLVVLSACETGLGEVKEGEGVYGLRRAFQMAGVRKVISALWSVADEVTAKMMSQLYDRQNAMLPETLRRIQLEKINELREQGEVDHPFTWGAFIALGDWR